MTIPPTHSVYTALNEEKRPLVLTRVAGGLTRREATTLAHKLRQNRDSSKTVVLVYRGDEPRSAF